MASERPVIREISWRDIFPWLVIFRTFGLAISMPVLFLATLGAVLTPIGWWISEFYFVPPASLEVDAPFAQVVQANRSGPDRPFPPPAPDDGRVPDSLTDILFTQPDVIQPVFARFVDPVARFFQGRMTLQQAGYFGFGMFWMLVIWGFYGGAITRIAVVKLGREEQISLGEALAHVQRKLLSYIFSPLFPLLGVVLLAVPIFLLGMLMRLEYGVLAAGILWIFALLGGLSIAILLLGTLFGWPLMWGVVSAEQHGDAFEAFSRSFSYTFGRPLHYLFYAVLATWFSGVSWLLVYHASELVIWVTRLPAEIGVGDERWSMLAGMIDRSEASTHPEILGAWLIGAFESVVRTIATAFGYSFFWCQAAAIYLLLRQDVDQTEFDEVFVEREDQRYELPPLPSVGSAAAQKSPESSPESSAESS